MLPGAFTTPAMTIPSGQKIKRFITQWECVQPLKNIFCTRVLPALSKWSFSPSPLEQAWCRFGYTAAMLTLYSWILFLVGHRTAQSCDERICRSIHWPKHSQSDSGLLVNPNHPWRIKLGPVKWYQQRMRPRQLLGLHFLGHPPKDLFGSILRITPSAE